MIPSCIIKEGNEHHEEGLKAVDIFCSSVEGLRWSKILQAKTVQYDKPNITTSPKLDFKKFRTKPVTRSLWKGEYDIHQQKETMIKTAKDLN